MVQTYSLLFVALVSCFLSPVMSAVVVDTIKEGAGPSVTREHRYAAHVTLYIENADKSKTPSGWSTRQQDGAAADKPFAFQPGVNLIQGWTQGVLEMREGQVRSKGRVACGNTCTDTVSIGWYSP